MASNNPVVGFTPKAATKIKRAVDAVLDGVPDFAALRSRRREVWDDGFWAVINCHCVWCTNKWKYSFVEVYRHCDQWIPKPNGRTGDCCGDIYALNSIEAYNDGTLDGNSVDYRISPGKMLPVQGSPVVWMRMKLGDDCTTDCEHNDHYNNSGGSSNDPKSRRAYYSFDYINHDNTADKTPPTPVDCCHTSSGSSPSSSSSSSSPSSQNCCPCYLVTYTLAEPPAQLQQAGPTDWTNETDTIYIQKGGGGWQLTINGDTFTAPDGPCPPLSAEAWTPALPFNITCGSCESSSSPSSSSPSSSPSSSSHTCGIKSITLGSGSGCTVTLDLVYCDGHTEHQEVTLDCCSSCSCSCCPSCSSHSCPSCSCPSCSHPSSSTPSSPSSSSPSSPSSSHPSSPSSSSPSSSSPSSSHGQLWTLTPCGGGTPIKTHEDLDSAIIGNDIVKWNGQCYTPGGPVPDDGTGINTATESEVYSSCAQCQSSSSSSHPSSPSSSSPSSSGGPQCKFEWVSTWNCATDSWGTPAITQSMCDDTTQPYDWQAVGTSMHCLTVGNPCADADGQANVANCPESGATPPAPPTAPKPDGVDCSSSSSTPSSSSPSSSSTDGQCYSRWVAYWNCSTHTWDIITQTGIECHSTSWVGLGAALEWSYVQTIQVGDPAQTKCEYTKLQAIADHTCHPSGDGGQGDCTGYNDHNTPTPPILDSSCQCPTSSSSSSSTPHVFSMGGMPRGYIATEVDNKGVGTGGMALPDEEPTPAKKEAPKPAAKKESGCGCGRAKRTKK